MKGYVYVITTETHNLVKVGFTLKDPEARAKELDGTSAPHPHVVRYQVLVEDPRQLEGLVHMVLGEHRTNGKREWFDVSVEQAVAAIRHQAGDGILYQKPADDLVSLNEKLIVIMGCNESEEALKQANLDQVEKDRGDQLMRDARAKWLAEEKEVRDKKIVEAQEARRAEGIERDRRIQRTREKYELERQQEARTKREVEAARRHFNIGFFEYYFLSPNDGTLISDHQVALERKRLEQIEQQKEREFQAARKHFNIGFWESYSPDEKEELILKHKEYVDQQPYVPQAPKKQSNAILWIGLIGFLWLMHIVVLSAPT